MSRIVMRVYSYACDGGGERWCPEEESVTQGDAIPKYRGATYPYFGGRVHSGDDADRVMRLRYGWSIGKVHLCPGHKDTT